MDSVLIGGKLFKTNATGEVLTMSINLAKINSVSEEDTLKRLTTVIKSLGYTIETVDDVKEYKLK